MSRKRHLRCSEPSRLCSPPARRGFRSGMQVLGPGQQPSALRAVIYFTTAQLSKGARSLWSTVWWCFGGCICTSDHLMLKFRSWPPLNSMIYGPAMRERDRAGHSLHAHLSISFCSLEALSLMSTYTWHMFVIQTPFGKNLCPLLHTSLHMKDKSNFLPSEQHRLSCLDVSRHSGSHQSFITTQQRIFLFWSSDFLLTLHSLRIAPLVSSQKESHR